ncbi:hypothetical protein GL297_15090 [Komagataeibacter sp. FXV2]|nr:hypothetical protein [Komagataeibacter sp. FXV2]
MVEDCGYFCANWLTAPDGGDLNAQVDAIVGQIARTLQTLGGDMAGMVKHTILVRAGHVDPIQAIEAVHRACHAHAPALVRRPGVGTIFCSPELGDPSALVAFFGLFVLDTALVAEAQRMLFHEMPMDVAKGVRIGPQTFLTGLEALEFPTAPDGARVEGEYHVAPEFVSQTEVVVHKIMSVLRYFELRPNDIQKLNVYLKTGLEDDAVRQIVTDAFSRVARHPVTMANRLQLIRGQGMAIPAFAIEIDGYALRPSVAADTAIPALRFRIVDADTDADWRSLCNATIAAITGSAPRRIIALTFFVSTAWAENGSGSLPQAMGAYVDRMLPFAHPPLSPGIVYCENSSPSAELVFIA